MKSKPTQISTLLLTLLIAAGCKPETPKLEPAPAPEKVAVHQAQSGPASATNSLAEPGAPSQPSGALPPGHPPVAGGQVTAAPTARSGQTVSGSVRELIQAGKYTYLQLDTTDGPVWTAVLKTEVAKGSPVEVTNASLMKDFASPTLGRTFETIWFGTLAGGASAPKPAPSAAPVEKTARATGAGAQSIAEIYAAKTQLNGQTVAVRGRVVKYNAGILGKNWIHIQDGTGDASASTHDLTVTTDAVTEKGKEITVRGVLVLDKDFGSGYRYAAIIEDAAVEAH